MAETAGGTVQPDVRVRAFIDFWNFQLSQLGPPIPRTKNMAMKVEFLRGPPR